MTSPVPKKVSNLFWIMAREKAAGNLDVRDELFQEANIACWRALETDPLASRQYLVAVGRNRMNAILMGRPTFGAPSHQGKRLVERRDEEPLPVTDKEQDDHSSVVADRLSRRLFREAEVHVDNRLLRAAVRCLPVQDRLLIFGRFVLDETWPDVGKRVGMSGNAAMNRFNGFISPRLQEAAIRRDLCLVCGKPDAWKPMCFKGVPWCSDLHRKVVVGELTPEQAEEALQGKVIRESDVMR